MTNQRHFRFRTDTGAADATPTWGSDEDSNTFSPGASPFRLRLSIENPTHTATGSFPYQIYLSKNGGAYTAVTTSSTNGIKSADAGSDADNTSIFVPRLTVPMWVSYAGAAIDLDFASDKIYPSGAFSDYLSCSRASIGYAKNSNGTLTQFSSNSLRITDRGLLVEDARTNLMLYSQDTTGSGGWHTDFQGTSINDSTTAPDGTSTGIKFTENSSAGRHMVYTGYVPGSVVSIGSTWTASLYINGGTRRYVCFNTKNGTEDQTYSVVLDTQTGSTVTRNTPNFTVETLGSGWYRINITATQITDTTVNVQVCGSDSASPTFASGGEPTYTGDGTSLFYYWGWQFEIAAFSSSYIPTTDASAARAADVITHVGMLQTDIAAATGSVVAQINNGLVAGVAANIVDSNGTNLLGFDASDHGLASITATLATSNTANRTTQDKLGIAWNASGRSLVLNGGTVATDANAQTPSSTQHIGSSGAGNFVYAYIERLTVWTSKLADATLQGFTS